MHGLAYLIFGKAEHQLGAGSHCPGTGGGSHGDNGCCRPGGRGASFRQDPLDCDGNTLDRNFRIAAADQSE